MSKTISITKNGDKMTVEQFMFEAKPKPIRGYPELHWTGKRPFNTTQYYPAQLKEVYGNEIHGWRNRIYWGDNLQVASHMLKEFRGKINLVYIDPPFASNADYRKSIILKGQKASSDSNPFEEKQYSDIWVNDEYLQFMYERIIILRELLSETGSIFIHCDSNKNYAIRFILDEVFGYENFLSEIIWKRRGGKTSPDARVFEAVTDTILWYSKTKDYTFNEQFTKVGTEKYIEERFQNRDEDGRLYRLSPLNAPYPRPTLQYEYKGYKPHPNGWSVSFETMEKYDKEGKLNFPDDKSKRIQRKQYLDEWKGKSVQALWEDIPPINPQASERLDYPTQKPEALLMRIIKTASKPGDLIFDAFMGAGTTQAIAMKSGRRFIGADINLGAIQITSKRLLEVMKAIKQSEIQESFFSEGDEDEVIQTYFTGFEVNNVNHYDVFRNPVEARDLLLEALEVNKLPQGQLFDGEKDGRLIKVMPVNRIATRADLGELIAGLDLKAFEKRHKKNPNEAVEKITLVCMGHEPDLKAALEKEADPYKLDVEVVDILRDRQDLQFKRDSEAKIIIKNGKLVIESFYPMNLLGKLSLQKEKVKKWQELVESVMIDWNYDGAVLTPTTVDIPEKNELVSGSYSVPKDAGTIRVKITDLLSESLEVEVQNG